MLLKKFDNQTEEQNFLKENISQNLEFVIFYERPIGKTELIK